MLKNLGTSLQHGAQCGFLAIVLSYQFVVNNPKVTDPAFEQIKILLAVTMAVTLCEFLFRSFVSQLNKGAADRG
jgi:hypothetical protein